VWSYAKQHSFVIVPKISTFRPAEFRFAGTARLSGVQLEQLFDGRNQSDCCLCILKLNEVFGGGTELAFLSLAW